MLRFQHQHNGNTPAIEVRFLLSLRLSFANLERPSAVRGSRCSISSELSCIDSYISRNVRGMRDGGDRDREMREQGSICGIDPVSVVVVIIHGGAGDGAKIEG